MVGATCPLMRKSTRMQIAADDLRRIERLHVRAWPALETATIHGWLWRYSGGGSRRAKAVGLSSHSKDVEIAATSSAEWREVYLGAISESRRKVNTSILDAVPQPCAYFSYRQAGRVISTALCVTDRDFAAVECMATRVEARRQGGAAVALRSLEAWAAARGARTLALQAVAINTPAVTLYTRFGFASVATNRFWVS
jgi:N-acetylglutamate synthase